MRRWLLFTLMLALGAGPAASALSPALDAMGAALKKGNALRLTIQAEIAAAEDLSESSLDALGRWLSRNALRVDIGEAGWDMALLRDKAQRFALSMRQSPRGGLLRLPDKGLTWLAGDDPLGELLGEAPLSPWLSASPGRGMRALFDALPALYGRLGEAPPAEKAAADIPYVGKSARRVAYALSEEELQALWPAALQAAAPALSLSLPGGKAAEIQALLGGLRFQGPGRLTRYLTDEGRDLALQYSGRVSGEGVSARKVSLRLGYQEKMGLFIDLKAPALRGKDKLNLTMGYSLAGEETARKLESALKCAWQQGKASGNVKAGAALTGSAEGGAERLSGSLWLEEGKERLTLTPDLLLSAGSAEGALSVEKRQGKKTAFAIKLTLSAALMPEGIPAIPSGGAVPLDSADALIQAQDSLGLALMPAMIDLIRGSDPQTIRKLLHELGRDWLPDVPGAAPQMTPTTGNDRFIVADEPAKEEDP